MSADDGTVGWPENAPYDRIIVTAAGPKVPEPLLEQLADPGILVIPVGDRYAQRLEIIAKQDNNLSTSIIESVRFVSLVGVHGWQNE